MMPHTCNMPIDRCDNTHSIYTRNECCSLCLLLMKTSTFSIKDHEKHFRNMSAISRLQCKYKKLFLNIQKKEPRRTLNYSLTVSSRGTLQPIKFPTIAAAQGKR